MELLPRPLHYLFLNPKIFEKTRQEPTLHLPTWAPHSSSKSLVGYCARTTAALIGRSNTAALSVDSRKTRNSKKTAVQFDWLLLLMSAQSIPMVDPHIIMLTKNWTPNFLLNPQSTPHIFWTRVSYISKDVIYEIWKNSIHSRVETVVVVVE